MIRQWRVILLVGIGVIVVVAGTMFIRWHFHRVELGILRERSEKILQALRDYQTPPAYYLGGEVAYIPPSWTISLAESTGPRGHVLATIDNPSVEGVAGTMVWEFKFQQNASAEWDCTAITTIGMWSDADGWSK